MVITTTAVGFIALTVSLCICSLWFLRAFTDSNARQNKSEIGFLLSLFFVAAALQNGFMGFGLLLFAKQPEVFYLILATDQILLGVSGMLGIYCAYYIFSPNRPALPAMFCVGILSIIGAVLSVAKKLPLVLTANGGVDFNMDFQLSFVTFTLLLINIGVTFYIFSRLFLSSDNQSVRRLAAIISTMSFLGVINVFVRLIVLYGANSTERTTIFDAVIGTIGALFMILLIGNFTTQSKK